ncbi:MAG: ABC transporter substrate-binding protein [Thermoplasmata archaeon]
MDPKWRNVIVIVIVVIIVLAGIGFYYYSTRAASCGLQSKNPLIMDQPEEPDYLDPSTTFTTPGWGAVQQVYQTLVAYNGSSYTNFSAVLAQNWSVSPDGFHYNFTLRPGITFSNGDPVNAYVMWYSLYRGLLMTQATQFILAENFWYPGLSDYNYNATESNAMIGNMTTWLNTFNFFHPTAPEIAIMSADNQSFRVLSPSVIQLNLGFGYLGPTVAYTYLLASIAAPIGSAIDPAVVLANGGVNQTLNSWMDENMVGTGPYEQSGTWTPTATSLVLPPNPNYWGTAAAAAAPWNNAIQPAHATIQFNFIGSTDIVIQDMKDGAAAAGSFAYIGPSQVQSLKSVSCLVVQALPVVYGATSGSWWVYLNQTQAPFSNWSVRAAVVHAINYTQIINLAFGGYASQWVGPVPPGYPYYDPGNLPPYPYNLTLAKQEMAASPYPNGYSGSLNYAYLNLGTWPEVAQLLKQDLSQIGITLNLVPYANVGILTSNLQVIDPSTGVCGAQETTYGGPFPIGQEFYTSDYISPDDWTQNDAISYGSANQCMAGYSNGTVDNLTIEAAGEHNASNLTADYAEMTSLMYYNYTDAWLAAPTAFSAYNSGLQGIVSNPMGSGLPFVMFYNTEYAS